AGTPPPNRPAAFTGRLRPCRVNPSLGSLTSLERKPVGRKGRAILDRVRGKSVGHGLQDLDRDRRCPLEQGPTLDGPAQALPHSLGCLDRRSPRQVRDEGDLAEEFAGMPRRQLLALARHLGLALEQNEELATPLTLANQHLVRGQVDLVRNRGDFAELALGERCEQRYTRDQVDLRRAAHAGRHATSLTAQVIWLRDEAT